MPNPQDIVHLAGGVARTSTLRDAGIGRARLDRALAAGEVVRVRRGWVAEPGADPYLVAAARAGVVVSCVTQASRLGLWVWEEDPGGGAETTPDSAVRVGPRPHVAAPQHAGRMAAEGAVVHWARPVVPRHPDQLTDEVENVLALVAACQPYEKALVVWESALRQGFTDRRALERLDWQPAARRLCAEVDPFADSGLESLVIPRLRWLRLPLRRQAWIAGRPVDLLIGERLVMQLDGGHHVGAQRERDVAHDAELTLLGYHVIRVGYGAIIDDWPAVQARIMRAVAQGLHRAA